MERAGEKSTTSTSTNRAIITRREPNLAPSSSQLAYFINISINNKKLHDPLANLRIKIPKLLAKTVKKSQQSNNNVGGGGDGTTKRSKKLFPAKKVKSLVSDALDFANKSGTTYLTDVFGGDKKPAEIEDNKESDFYSLNFDQNGLDDLGSFPSESLSSRNSRVSLYSEEPYLSAIKSPLWDDVKQNGQQICMICKQRLSEVDYEKENFKGVARSPALSFLGLRGKGRNASKEVSSVNSNSVITVTDQSFRKERDSWTWSNNYLKESEKEHDDDDDDDDDDNEGEEDEDDQELCKKRILMGQRCRPLNFTGAIKSGSDWSFRLERGGSSSNNYLKESGLTEKEHHDDKGEEEELCKKRILMGQRCWTLPRNPLLEFPTKPSSLISLLYSTGRSR